MQGFSTQVDPDARWRFLAKTVPNDGSAQDAALAAAFGAWATDGASSFGAQYPALTSRPMFVPSGEYHAASTLTVSPGGTGQTIMGDGPSSRLDNVQISRTQNKLSVHDLALTGASAYGIYLTTASSNEAQIDRVWIRDRTVGIDADNGSNDQITNTVIEKCGYGARIKGGANRDFTAVNSISNTIAGFAIFGGGETRFANCRAQGNPINIWMRGSTRSQVVENYFDQMSSSQAVARTMPIVAVDDNGGFVRLQISTKISITSVANLGGCFVGGRTDQAAYSLLSLGTGTSGSLTALTANGTALISGTVSLGSDRPTNALAIAAAVNANTGSTGYTAQAFGGKVYINAALADGASANGRTLVATASGITVTPQNYVSFTFASAHGLSEPTADAPGGLFEYSGDVAAYAGIHPVHYVPSTTVAVVPFDYASTSTGLAWKPIFLRTGLPNVSIANSGGAYDHDINITAIDDTRVTLDVATAGFPVLPGGSVVSTPGWDLYVEVTDTGITRCNDIRINGGNFNRALFVNAYNFTLNGVRIKELIWIANCANPDYKSNRINVIGPDRGRDDLFPFSSVNVMGANTGWTYKGSGASTDSRPGGGYTFERTPNNAVACTFGVPVCNETRTYESGKVEHIIADVVVLMIDKYGSRGPLTIATLPSAVSNPGMWAWVTDATPTDKRCQAIGSHWVDSAGTNIT